jgi:hypothetical protein
MRASDLSPRAGRRLFDIPLCQTVQTLGKSSTSWLSFITSHFFTWPAARIYLLVCSRIQAAPILVRGGGKRYIHEVCDQNRPYVQRVCDEHQLCGHAYYNMLKK